MNYASWTDVEVSDLNAHLIIGAYHAPPLLIIRRPCCSNANGNTTTQYSGFIKDILDHLSEAVGFTFEMVDVFANRDVNGTMGPSDVLISMMHNKKIDLAARLMVLSAERNALVDFATTFVIEPIVMLQPLPKWKIDVNAMFQPFQPQVWSLLLVSFLLTAVVLTCTSIMSRSRTLNAYQHRKSVFEIAGDLLVYVFSVITCQGGQIGNRWLSTILIAGSWCLAAVVIVNGYSSTLTSFLSVRSYDPVVSTWQDVAKSRLQLIVERNSVLEDIIMKSQSGPMATLAESLRKHPERRFGSFEEYIKLTKNGMFAMPLAKVGALERVFNAMKKNKGECTLTFASPTVSYTTMHSLFMRKGFHFTDEINQALLVMIHTGITERMKSSYMEITDKCSVDKLSRQFKNNSSLRPFKLSSFHGLFFILGIGYGVASLAFLAELAVNFAKNHKKRFLIRKRYSQSPGVTQH